jgi:transposase
MQGEKLDQEDLFFYGSLDSLVPQDDPYRRLNSLLSLAWLRTETRHLYASTGRPSVDPVVIAKLLLIAYLQGITSERELMRQVQVNLSYRRFLHYRLSEALPDHSNLTRSRQRLGEKTIRRIFEYVLQLCLDAGLVGGELESVDSTFVQANASLSSLRPRLVEVEAERFTRQLFRLNPAEEDADEEEDKTPGGGGRRKKLRRNDAYVSKTDPDAGIDRRGAGKSRLGYLVHYAVDRSKQIITGVLTVGAHVRDATQLTPVVDEVLRQGIAVRAVVADGGYSSGEAYREMAQRGIEAYLPLQSSVAERQGRFGQDRFTYQPSTDSYVCPNGAQLRRQQQKQPTSERRYRASDRDCGPCPLRERCTTGRARTLTVHPHEAHLLAARALQKTTAARRAARERKICSERTFAEAKEQHGLRRAQRRGRANVHTQALLTAAAINLKRYLQAQTRLFPASQAVRLSFLPKIAEQILRGHPSRITPAPSN